MRFDPKRLVDAKKKKQDSTDQPTPKRSKEIAAPSKLTAIQSSPKEIIIDMDVAPILIVSLVKSSWQSTKVAHPPPKESMRPMQLAQCALDMVLKNKKSLEERLKVEKEAKKAVKEANKMIEEAKKAAEKKAIKESEITEGLKKQLQKKMDSLKEKNKQLLNNQCQMNDQDEKL
uniref:Uncharacterized protein LOC105045124 n=1 Tax=Elaeis guineensis var. tenera TaxID=51953 RepID=A0A6I9R8K0_ELAGV|nr:uncharacterized protein LOC105045124 [Elaeis guineensis]